MSCTRFFYPHDFFFNDVVLIIRIPAKVHRLAEVEPIAHRQWERHA